MSEPRPLTSQLPASPNLRHLKDQARDLVRCGEASSLALALLQVARRYGFVSWPKLKAQISVQTLASELKEAINHDDFAEVRHLLSGHPDLRHAPIGYAGDGALTWAAECRGLDVPSSTRLEIAKWLISTGSDVHEGGDAPLMRASLSGARTAMMQLLVSHGAKVNAAWHGSYPIIFAPCETLDATSLRWLLAHGADPNCAKASLGQSSPETALDSVLGTYVRDKDAVSELIAVLQNAGGSTKYDEPGVLATILGDTEAIDELMERDASILQRKYQSLDIGTTAGRMLTLKGATLLHIAAEFGQVEVAEHLLAHGTDVNATALVDSHGIGGQTAIFHAATQGGNFGIPMVRLLLARGADLSVCCRLPGHYERLEEVFEGTAIDYARLFPESGNLSIGLLNEKSAK